MLADAVVYTTTFDWDTRTALSTYALDPKKVRQVILDKLKRVHAEEIFERTEAAAGVYTKPLNEEYVL